jgi:hypothetical protein
MVRMRVAVVVAALLGAAGCGGGSDALSGAEFIEQGDAVCERLTDQVNDLDQPTSEEELGDHLRAIAALEAEARDDFAALEPPSEGEDVQRALLDAADEANERTLAAADAADEGDTVTAEDLMSSPTDGALAAGEAMRDYGFEVCGGGS